MINWRHKSLFGMLLLLAALQSHATGPHPHFLILKEGSNFPAEVAQLVADGARPEHKVPPRVLTVSAPSTMDLTSVAIEKDFVSVIPIAELNPLGPLAVALGLQWNQGLLRKSQPHGANALGAQALGQMRALIARQSLPAPEKLTLSYQYPALKCDWEAVQGALFYHLQTALDPSFGNILTESRTSGLSALLPLFGQKDTPTLYVRVRAADKPNPENSKEDLFGAWSRVQSISLPPITETEISEPPDLTSPVNNYKSFGSNIILEWTSSSPGPDRLQIARDHSFSEILVDELTGPHQYAGASALLHIGKKYYWRVQAGEPRKSPWSSTRTFSVEAPRNTLKDMFINPESSQPEEPK